MEDLVSAAEEPVSSFSYYMIFCVLKHELNGGSPGLILIFLFFNVIIV